MRVLLAGESRSRLDPVRRYLAATGWNVDLACNLEHALWQSDEAPYDAIVFDADDADGAEFCRTVRAQQRWEPLLLIESNDIGRLVDDLDAGADDVLLRPFADAELGARLRCLVRRDLGRRPAQLVAGSITLDPGSRTVVHAGRPVALTAREYSVLEVLIRRAGLVVSRSTLLDHAWDTNYTGLSNVVDVYIGYLRRKFGPRSIATVRGVGYRLTVESVNESG